MNEGPLLGGPLDAADLRKLAEAGISPDLARRAGLRRVDSPDGAEIVGRNGSRDYSGILFPYIWPGTDHVREFRLRRDRPEIEHGKPKDKYLSPSGRGNMLYIPPGTSPEWLDDGSLP